MSKTFNFFRRNLKELLRDPLIYVFCLGFPIIMLVIFQVINRYVAGANTTFELSSLLPGIIVFSYAFVMLIMALLVSKDRQTMFLKRLYSSPMKARHFIVGYSLVGIIVGIAQTIICVLTGFIISLISGGNFIPFSNVLLLIASQLPVLITCVFIGLIIGSLLGEKSAPGLCSVFISLIGMLGGCWMPIETMGGIETFARFLPFYPSVYIGRITTGAINSFNMPYLFDNIAKLGLIPIFVFMGLSIVLSIVSFKKNMVSDK